MADMTERLMRSLMIESKHNLEHNSWQLTFWNVNNCKITSMRQGELLEKHQTPHKSIYFSTDFIHLIQNSHQSCPHLIFISYNNIKKPEGPALQAEGSFYNIMSVQWYSTGCASSQKWKPKGAPILPTFFMTPLLLRKVATTKPILT